MWPEALPAAVEIAAYRIVLEAVTNVTRHARAGVCRGRPDRRRGPAVEVIDDGEGLGADSGEGVGLRSMRERAEELGGEFHVAPARRAAAPPSPRGSR